MQHIAYTIYTMATLKFNSKMAVVKLYGQCDFYK